MLYLRQATSGQNVEFGPFLSVTDGYTRNTTLAIKKTDVQLHKHNTVVFANATSGSGVHLGSGYYYFGLDQTDTNTMGRLVVKCDMPDCLPVWHEYTVLPSSVFDDVIVGSGLPRVDVRFLAGNGTAGTNLKTEFDGTGYNNLYHADIHYTVDGTNTRDEYTIQWYKNGLPITADVTSPTLQVVRRSDGGDQIAESGLTQIGSTACYKGDVYSTARLGGGEAYIAIVSATIDGSTRTWRRPISRDST